MLTFAAVLPAAFLLHYIYQHDTVEKEPVSLLIRILVFGMIATIPTSLMEGLLGYALGIFVNTESRWYHFLHMFFVVALVEEYWKRWAARKVWNHPAFNYRFDAVVYCVSAALGFAALENVLYVMNGGLATAMLRAFTAVPSHAIDGVIMGCFFGEAKLRERLGDERGKRKYLRLSLWIPAIAHGIYDYSLVSDWEYAGLFFVLFVVCVDIWAVRYIRRASQQDMPL